jgi:predicted nucleotidyltransferase
MRFLEMSYEYQLRLAELFKEYRNKWRHYVEVIKKLGNEFFGGNLESVVVFGSTTRGNYSVFSDIDVAIILKRTWMMRVELSLRFW